MKQREGTGPVHAAAHLHGVRVLPVEDPLAEGVKQDIRREPRREHHRAPLEETVLRLLIRRTEHDAAIARECDVERHHRRPEADQEIVQPEAVPQEGPDTAEHGIGRLRQEEKQQCQHHDQRKRHQRDHPVDATTIRLHLFEFFIHVPFHVHFLLLLKCFEQYSTGALSRQANSAVRLHFRRATAHEQLIRTPAAPFTRCAVFRIMLK